MKKILISLLAIAVVLIVVLWLTLSNLDSIVKSIIETTGSRIFDTPVKVETVEIQLQQGQATVRGLTVANPPGYSSEPAMEFGEITARINKDSGDLDLVRVTEPVARLELKGKESNFAILHEKVARPLGRGTGKEGRGDGPGPQTQPAEPREEDAATAAQDVITIHKLEITGTRMLVSADWLKENQELVLDHIAFSDLKADPETIARVVMSELINRVLKSAGKKLMKSRLEQELEERGLDKLKDLLK